MEVEWRLDPAADGEVVVTIVHELTLRWPLIGGAVARWIVGPLFVEPIAARTLAQIKALAEHERRNGTDVPVPEPSVGPAHTDGRSVRGVGGDA
jgi:hypothetical protein